MKKLEMLTVLDVFSALAKVMPGYIERSEQLRMAQDMYQSLRDGVAMLAHGPCGVGKSKAVLIAAALLARQEDKRVLYLTSMTNLQEQLARDDLPDVARAFRELGIPGDSLATTYTWRELERDDGRNWLPYCVLKGASNYVCEREVEKALATLHNQTARQLPENVSPDGLGRLIEWTEDYHDVSDLPHDFDVSPEMWEMVSLGAGQCRGKACKREREECRFLGAKKKARNSRVVVINYASLFTSVSMAEMYGGQSILDVFDYIICDEGHRVESEARRCLGFDLTPRQFFRTASKLGARNADLRERLGQRVTDLFDAASRWAVEADSGHGRTWTRRAHGRVRPSLDVEPLVNCVGDAVRAFTEEIDATDDEEREVDLVRARRTLATLRDCVVEFSELACDERVYYVAGERERSCRLVAELLEPADALRRMVWEEMGGIVVMSATLATGERDPFKRVRQTIGLPDDARGERYRSPFDWSTNSVLVVPSPAPDVSDDDDVAYAVLDAVARSGGGALVLTTRWAAVDVIADYLEENLPLRIIVHRQRPNASRVAVVQAFRDDPDSVLVGTASMWTGVDVPGDSLRLLVVCKLPFPSPDSPYVAGMEERVKRRLNEAHASGDRMTVRELSGWRSFRELSVPSGERDLQQGVGRALRSVTDRCAVVVLDARLVDKPYGREMQRALPDGLCSGGVRRDWDALDEFYAGQSRAV